jgi:hypothetical protein
MSGHLFRFHERSEEATTWSAVVAGLQGKQGYKVSGEKS